MLLGTWELTVDQLGYLKLPAALQPLLSEGLVATRSLDPCIQLLPHDVWAALAERVRLLPIGGAAERSLRRLIFGAACELRDQGEATVVLPQPLRAYAAITTSVVIVGSGTYLELWSPEHWAQLNSELMRAASSWPDVPGALSSLAL